MINCQVCWNCRGLILSPQCNSSTVENHVQSCCGNKISKSSELFEYFVCDKVDYQALKHLKTSLNKYGHHKLSDHTVLPSEIIHALRTLCLHHPPAYGCQSLQTSASKILLNVTNRQTQTLEIFDHDQIEFESSPLSISQCQEVFRDLAHSKCDTFSESPLNAAEKCLKDSKNMDTKSLQKIEQVTPTTSVVVVISGDKKTDNMKNWQTWEADQLKAQCSASMVGREVFYTCKVCTYKTKSDRIMLRHLGCHNNGASFQCSLCMFTTIWRRKWKQHVQNKHGASDKQGQSVLPQHSEKKESLQSGDSVPAGSKKFTTKVSLECDECSYKARNMMALKEHQRKHTGEVIGCPHENCSFTTMYKRSLCKHLRQKHAQEKSQSCPICQFQTRHSSSLKKHMMLHKDLKLYQCSLCAFKALYPSAVLAHVRSKHLKLKRFSCPHCKFQTSYPLAIQKHVQRHRKHKYFACSICGQEMEKMGHVKRHMLREHGAQYSALRLSSSEKVKPKDFEIKVCSDSHAGPSKDIIVVKQIAGQVEVDAGTVVSNTDQISDSETRVTDFLNCTGTETVSVKLEKEPRLFSQNSPSNKVGNPMLSATSSCLNDNDSTLMEDSILELMSDMPRPTTLNRSQSASTLMFSSSSPHFPDRCMTPDFLFTESPSVGSFFLSFSKMLDPEPLNSGNTEKFETTPQAGEQSSQLAVGLELSQSCLPKLSSAKKRTANHLPVLSHVGAHRKTKSKHVGAMSTIVHVGESTENDTYI